MSRPPERIRELLALGGILTLGCWLRFGALGADMPLEVGLSYAPIQDAAWYVETAARQAEGVALEPQATPWDVSLWSSLATTWFRLWGAGPAPAHALGALFSAATVLALWRFLRPLGSSVALSGAAALAVLYPVVLLGRSSLVYGPAALFLLSCAALWRVGKARAAKLRELTPNGLKARRAGCEVCAWALLLLGCWSLRPPLAALAGGLFAGHVVRSARPRRWLLAGAAALVLGGVALLALPVLRNVSAIDQFAYRLELHGFSLDPARLAVDLLRVAGDPDTHGSGFARLALVPLLAAAWGWVVIVQRWPQLSPSARETLALCAGWLAGFYLASLPFSVRPLRYWALIGPPLAALIGVALSLPRTPRPLTRIDMALIAIPGGIAGAHALAVLGELFSVTLPPLGLAVCALLGGSACVLLATLPQFTTSARLRPLLTALVLGATLVPSCELVLWPSNWTHDAREATAELLDEEAILCGPYAPILCQGTGRTRRLAYQLRTDKAPDGSERLPGGLAWAREAGVTHIALGVEQEQSSQLRYHCARLGFPLEVVGLLYVGGPPDHDLRRRRVRGAHVLVLRFPWSEARTPVEDGARPLTSSTLHARVAGLCAAGDPDLAYPWLLDCPPRLRGELEATIRRTPRLPSVSDRKY